MVLQEVNALAQRVLKKTLNRSQGQTGPLKRFTPAKIQSRRVSTCNLNITFFYWYYTSWFASVLYIFSLGVLFFALETVNSKHIQEMCMLSPPFPSPSYRQSSQAEDNQDRDLWRKKDWWSTERKDSKSFLPPRRRRQIVDPHQWPTADDQRDQGKINHAKRRPPRAHCSSQRPAKSLLRFFCWLAFCILDMKFRVG